MNRIAQLIKPINKNNFAIVCYYYAFETSPFLKSLCSWIYDNGYGVTNVFIDFFGKSNLSTQKGVHIVKFNSVVIKSLNKYIKLDKETLYLLLLKIYLKPKFYKYVFAIDYQSLDILNRISYPANNISFVSLEGTDFMRHYSFSEVLKILPKCQSYIVASKERGQEINDYLLLKLKFIYFPVSLRPKIKLVKELSANPKIIFSGYFARWSGLEDLIDLYTNSFHLQPSSLYLQGHYYGTDKYFETIQNKVKFRKDIIIDTDYYPDDEHHELLSKFEIGVAFYKNFSGTDNFENLIFSSGKIAAYLWAGLAVMTNIDCELTKKPPFIFIKDIKLKNFLNGLIFFENKKEEFHNSAYELAQNHYNFDTYMKGIFERNIFPLAKMQ